MSNSLIDLDEITAQMNKVRITALQHAAEISPLVKERTLGPDKDPWKEDNYDRIAADENATKYQTKGESVDSGKLSAKGKENLAPKIASKGLKSTEEKNTAPSIMPINFILKTMSVEDIMASVRLREAEHIRRRANLQKIIEMHDKHLTKLRQSLEPICQQQHQRDEERRLSDHEIEQISKERTAKELEERRQQMDGLRKQGVRQMHVITFNAISQYLDKFRARYEVVAHLLLSNDDKSVLSSTEHNQQLQEVVNNFEQLIGTIKTGQCGIEEVKTAIKLGKSMYALEQSIVTEWQNMVSLEHQKAEADIREESEKLQQQEEAAAEAALAVQTEVAAAAAAHSAEATSTASTMEETQHKQDFISSTELASNIPYKKSDSSESYERYTKLMSFYYEKVEKVKPLETNAAFKQYCAACKKAIVTSVNAISPVSPQFLQDKFDRLFQFINGQPINTTNIGRISVNDHPLGRDFCLLLMAKKFVNQGDQAVSSRPSAAFAFASVIVSLWKVIPEFGDLYLACTYKESPLLVPYLVPVRKHNDVTEFYLAMGYRMNDGTLEKQDLYLKRQSGIARLYAAIMITGGRKIDGPRHPFSLQNAWVWMAETIRLEPYHDISATLMEEMIQTVAADMLALYGSCFVKLLACIQQQYLPKLAQHEDNDQEAQAPRKRLEHLLTMMLQNGKVQRPAGMLPPGYW